MLGILLIDKPPGITSHDVVNRVRRMLGTRRVGHAGTLDPLATGLLVVAVGPATRFLQYLPLEPKVYVADVQFGQSSTTYDAEGDLSAPKPPPANIAEAIAEVAPRFSGLIQQIPPMFSAIKVGGQPLYKAARQGQEIEREPRTIHISDLSILETDASKAAIRIVCSGGTYVRSLAHDLGNALGCGAYLSKLVRTNVGRFALSDAIPLESVSPEHLMPLHQALPPMPLVDLDEGKTQRVREGSAVGVATPPDSRLVALRGPNGLVFSVARVEGNILQPECVIPAEVADGIV